MPASTTVPLRPAPPFFSAGKAAVALALLVAAVFSNGLRVPFLLDDEITIQNNEANAGLWSSLFPRLDVHTRGRPLLGLSFALNHQLGGMNPAGYHLANIAIHVLATLALFGIVRRTLTLPLLRARYADAALPVAFGAALVWALHPLQTISVTYISQRAESLMGFFYLATLYAFIRATETSGRLWRAAAIACCCLGMLVKEVMVTAPVVIFLFDRLLVAGSWAAAWRERRTLHLALAASWGVLAAILYASSLSARGVGFGFTYSWLQYLQVECYALVRYVQVALWPFPLVFDYGGEHPIPPTATLALCVTALALVAAGIAFAWRNRPYLAFLGCWFFIILLPTSSIVPVAGQPISENRVYLPLAAFAVGFAATACHFVGRRARGLVFFAAAALGVAAVARNHVYRTNLTIWHDTVVKRPDSFRAQYYYATALLHAGRLDEGMKHLLRASAIRPNDASPLLNMASALTLQRRYAESVPYSERALKLQPDNPMAHANFASALFELGRIDDALAHYQEAMRLNPTHTDAPINRAIVLARIGRMDEAIAGLREVLKQHPDHPKAKTELALMLAYAQAAQSPSR